MKDLKRKFVESYWLEKLDGEIPKITLPLVNVNKIAGNTEIAQFNLEINKEISLKLKKITKDSHTAMFILFLSGLNIALYKYTGIKDLVIGTMTPVEERFNGELIFCRNQVELNCVVKEAINRTKQTVLEAFEYGDHPFGDIFRKLQAKSEGETLDIFNVAFIYDKLQNNSKVLEQFDLLLVLSEPGDQMILQVHYNSARYSKEILGRFCKNLINIFDNFSEKLDLELSSLDIVSDEEKKQLLAFNNTVTEFPMDKTLPGLFEEQAEKNPDNIAVVFENEQITYGELNKSANRVARMLSRSGVKNDSIVGLMPSRSTEMIIGLWGILKSGGAYLPIDHEYPQERINYMLSDSGANVLLTTTTLAKKAEKLGQGEGKRNLEIYFIDSAHLSSFSPSNPHASSPSSLAYVIYTSGTTGRSKGVMIENRSVANFIKGITNNIPFQRSDRILSLTTICFDIFVLETILPLTMGSRVIIGTREEQLDASSAAKIMVKENITIFQSTPSRLQLYMVDSETAGSLKKLKYLLVGGELFPEMLLNKLRKLIGGKVYNVYGPTETTVWSTLKDLSGKVPLNIGKPIANTYIFMLNRNGLLQPFGVPGELCISGDGVARGYLNRPELTVEKFYLRPAGALFEKTAPAPRKNSLLKGTGGPGPLLYQTGDLARWLPDWDIEFLGRLDHQVKIRGFRIEPGEIENRLLEIEIIKEAVVLARESKEGIKDNCLCAYVVSDIKLSSSQLREYLSKDLPDYMIPAYFMQMDKIPLTPNGKIDRKALPDIEARGDKEKYAPPRNNLERKLVEIWSEVLGIKIEDIGIDHNFFKLGGQSLKATVMLSQVHKELNVKVPLRDIYETFSIRNISQYLERASIDKYSAIEKAEKKEYYSLSSGQKRLYAINQMEPEITVYNLPQVISLPQDIKRESVEETLRKLILRHESLRTSFEIINGIPVQVIHDIVKFEIEYHHFLDNSENFNPSSFINNHFIRPFDLSQAPLMRTAIVEPEEGRYLLIVDIHHIITDGVSQEILVNEFNALYSENQLPPLRIQYKDFAEWQNIIRDKQKDSIKAREAYWVKEFSGEIPVLNLPIDYSRPPIQSFEGSTINFAIDREYTVQIRTLASRANATLFMTLLALCNVLLAKLSGSEDIVLGTPIAGRNYADLGPIMGFFVNTLVFRNYPAGEKTFKSFLENVKQKTLAAFENQEYQFEDLVEKVAPPRDTGRNPMFDVGFILHTQMERAKMTNKEKMDRKSKFYEHQYESQISMFDLTLTGVETGDKLYFSVIYCTKLFKSETVERFISYFKKIVSVVIQYPDIKITAIELMSAEEKKQVLYTFNDTKAEYPVDKRIDELFEEQAARKPDSTAVIGEAQSTKCTAQSAELGCAPGYIRLALTYNTLNKKSHQLACLLKDRGVQPGNIVGIMVERSLDMIAGILGILKAGGAYLPIDPRYPRNRILSMLEDCDASILLTETPVIEKLSFTALQNPGLVELEVQKTQTRQQITDFESLPIPDRSLVNYEKFNDYIGQAMVRHCISLQATRGCPYKCAFCHKIWPKNHMVRSAENIFAEIKRYYDIGVRRFAFIDDIFNLNIKNSQKFFELILENQLKVHLFFPNGIRGDILTKEYIDLMVKAGTINMAFALETASPRLQKLIRKNLNLKKFRENLEYVCEKYPQVLVELFTMAGFPSETEEEAMMTLDFIKSVKWLHFPYISYVRIFSGSDMAKIALEKGISRESIAESENLAYHELPSTLPFDHQFTKMHQADFLNNYFLLKERLLNVLPFQMRILTEHEIVKKYNSYLSLNAKNLEDLLQGLGISTEELKADGCVDEESVSIPDLNVKMKKYFPAKKPSAQALRILLLDLSQSFSHEAHQLNDLVEPPLGLMCLLTYINEKYKNQVNGRIAKSFIDFNSFAELKKLLDEFKPDLIGIRTLTFYRNFFHKTVAIIRQWRNDVTIITGGPYATSDYRGILKDRNIDLVVRGEGEITFSEVIQKIIDNNGKLPDEETLKEIDGIAFIHDKENSQKKFARQIIMLDELTGLLPEESIKRLPPVKKSTDWAYVIYTSGSTGKPKGTLTKHHNVNRVVKNTNYIHIRNDDRLLQLSNYTFDGSVFDIFGALLNGAALVLTGRENVLSVDGLADLIKREEITVFFITTALFNALVDLKIECLENIRKVLFGGERVSLEHSKKALKYLGKDRIIHVYGPTETTVYATYYFINQIDERSVTVPIGKPIANTTVYILDKELKPAAPGINGEVYIGGHGLACGYLNSPELTAEKFSKNPFYQALSHGSLHITTSPGPNHNHDHLLYRTGDLARWLADGNIEFTGRIDHQVKIRGFRIELGEIELQLLRHGIIKETIVLAREDRSGNNCLCAYIVTDKDKGFKVSELRDHLSRQLPVYMIPSYFVNIKKIPLNSNGKIDMKALPEPEIGAAIDYVPPGNTIEEKLVEALQEVLGIDNIGITDNFFELGGDSIKAIQVSARLRQDGLELKLSDLFLHSTIKELGKCIRQASRTIYQGIVEGKVPLTPIQEQFFEKNYTDRHHFNQGVTLFRSDGFNQSLVEKVFQKIVEHHDALRMVYVEEGSNIIQDNRGLQGKLFHLETVNINLEKREDIKIEIEQKAGGIQQEININQGPLVKIVLFKSSPGGFLLIIIHQLVVDSVSWKILLEDFAIGYNQLLRGEEIKFQAKTDSYCAWANKMTEYAESKHVLKELDYWKGVIETKVKELPTEPKIGLEEQKCRHKLMYSDSETIHVVLDKENTDMLLHQVHRAYNTVINEILLAALAKAVKDWTGIEKILLNLEGHGRETIIDNIDISRTVGWFTTRYPVVLTVDEPDNLELTIISVKETLRHIPNKGLGFGILRYLTPGYKKAGLSLACEPEISFNYLGEWEQENHPDTGIIRLSNINNGHSINPESDMHTSININGLVTDGTLILTFTFNKHLYERDSMEQLAAHYRSNLIKIIDHCSQKEEIELTPSDFNGENIDMKELDNIAEIVAGI